MSNEFGVSCVSAEVFYTFRKYSEVYITDHFPKSSERSSEDFSKNLLAK